MNIIDKIYERNLEFVKGFEVHTGVKESVADIYPDKAHFIYELLQNAEDTQATETSIELYQEKLVFTHNGRPFDEKDIDGICTIGASNKKNDETTIGKFGVGFKSVFLYTNSPKIWSEKYKFKIENLILPSKLDENSKHHGTKFEFPFNNEDKPPKIAFSEIKDSLDELSQITLLFLKKIKILKIKITFDSKIHTYEISKKQLQGNLVKVSYLNNIKKNNEFYYLVFSKQSEQITQKINIAFQLILRSENKKINLDVGYAKQFSIISADPGLVSVSFPLAKETSKLKFFINAPFITDRARSSLKNHETNDKLFIELQDLFLETIQKLNVMNFLNREFYEILPISRDELTENYEQLRVFIIKILRENKFLKTASNKLECSQNLLKGPKELRELLSDDDLKFILTNQSDKFWAMPVNASSRINILYNDLNLDNFDGHNLLDFLEMNAEIYDDDLNSLEKWTPQTLKNDFMEWINKKNITWHQKFYSYLFSLEEYEQKKIDEYNISNWLIFRLSEENYSTKDNLYFPEEIGSQFLNTIDYKLLDEGINKKLKAEVKSFFNHVGVKKFDEKEKIKLILKERYHYKNFNPKIEDMILFLEYYKQNPNEIEILNEKIFLNSDNKYTYAYQIYVNREEDKGFEEFINLKNKTKKYDFQHFKKLSENYLDIKIDQQLLENFTVALGAQKEIQIYYGALKKNNPEYNSLISDLYKTKEVLQTRISKDFYIEDLEKVLKNTISKDLSVLIWNTINSKYKNNIFRALYKPNNKFSTRSAPSFLMTLLRDNNWLYSNKDKYLSPSDLSKETINSIYSFDESWESLKYLEFGKNEQKNLETEERLKNTIKEIGINENFVDVFKKIQETFSIDELSTLIEKEQEKRESSTISEDEVKNSSFRSRRTKEMADEAPERFFEIRKRSVPSGASSETKNLATRYLIQEYTSEGVLCCQICNKQVPFKLNNGNFYFEKVRFLDNLRRDHQHNFIALCANHSAMFQYTLNENENLVDKIKNIETNFIEIEIGQKLHKIYFTQKHILDLKAIILSEKK